MQSASEALKEFFSKTISIQEQEILLKKLAPDFLRPLQGMEEFCSMCPDRAIVIESRMIYAFTSAFASKCTSEEMESYLLDKALKRGGYFYELAFNFHIFMIWTDALNRESYFDQNS